MKQSGRFSFIVLALMWLIIAQSAPIAFAQTPQPTQVEVKIDPKIFDRYVGQYEDAANLGGSIF